MAKQLNLLSAGQVTPIALHTEMQQSYLEYAMSVIVGRALPDVQDGLKPVHRRILYAMHELGLTPDRPYRKCARVVGDVLGKYHPHGDQAVYDALVRLVQDFSTRYPLLAGHGNFGSVDNDPPAAMRYTETRLDSISHEALLSEIGEATVDFTPNFDNSQQEPVVLPAQLPFLLLNGSAGIAVGMATNVPPHNLAELVDGLIALIDRPELPDSELFRLIPAPDFPTGGEIISLTGVWEAYRTGRGSIPVRGIAQLEQVQSSRGRRRDAIVITELPYQVNKASWIEKVAELVNQGKIDGISDIRDESDRDGMRVVIEMKRESDPSKILDKLHKLTALQTTFGAIFLALVDGLPRQLSLRGALQAFLSFRETTLNRRYRHELGQASDRLHIVEGLLTALTNLDAVIDLLRHAPDGSTAEVQLQSRFDLSEQQASAILSMPLRRLTGLEHQKLQTERDELTRQMQGLEKLLGDRRELLKALKKDLRTLKRKYSDPRRTRIPQGDAAIYQEPPQKPQAPEAVDREQVAGFRLQASDDGEQVSAQVAGDSAQVSGDMEQVAEQMPSTSGQMSGDGAQPSEVGDADQAQRLEIETATQLSIADPAPPTPHSQLRTPNSAPPTPHSQLRTPNSALPTPHSQLRTPNSALPTPHPTPSPEDILWECSIEPGKPTKVSTPSPTPHTLTPTPPLFTLELEAETVVEFTQRGYVRRLSPKVYDHSQRLRYQATDLPDPLPALPIVPDLNSSLVEDVVVHTRHTTVQTALWTVTSDGKLYPVPVGAIPLTNAGTNRGKPLVTLLPGAASTADHAVVLHFIPPVAEPEQPDLVILSQQGRIKRLALTEFADLSARGLTVIKLRQDDRVAFATLLHPHDQLILATCGGRLLCIANGDLPVMSRGAQSQPALRLRQDEYLVGGVAAASTTTMLLISRRGYLKSMPVEAMRMTRLGGLGMQGFQFASRTDLLATAVPALAGRNLVLSTSHDRSAWLPMEAIVHLSQETSILQLATDEQIVDVILAEA